MKSGTIFDNWMTANDTDEARAAGEARWAVTKDAEKVMKDEQDEVGRAKAEAEDDKDLGDVDEDEEEEGKEDADEEEEKAKHQLELGAEKMSFWKNLQTEDVHQEAAEKGEAEDDKDLGDIDEEEEEAKHRRKLKK